MIIAYVDETGNTGGNIDDPQQKYHYAGALLVPETTWEPVKEDLRKIAIDALGKHIATAPNFELHGNQLFGGNGPWNSMPDRNARLKVFSSCLDLLERHDLRMVYGTCDKQKLQRYSKPMHPHEISFWLALERIGSFYKQRNSFGFIVADECAVKMKQVAKKVLDDYRSSGAPFGKTRDISRIIDNILFMRSVESWHLQMCDLCLWVIQRFRASGKALSIPKKVFSDPRACCRFRGSISESACPCNREHDIPVLKPPSPMS